MPEGRTAATEPDVRWDLELSQTLSLIAALVDAGEAVVPTEGVFVQKRPEDSKAKGAGTKKNEPDAAPHFAACRVVVGKGAEADAGVLHAGSGARKGEEKHVIEDEEDQQRYGGSDGGNGGGRERPNCVGERRDSGEKGHAEQAGVNDGSHQAISKWSDLDGDVELSLKLSFGADSRVGDGAELRQDDRCCAEVD